MDNKQKIHKKLYNFIKKIIGTRILRKYMVHLGIDHFQTNTLVPLSLLLGKKEFATYIKNTVQRGGGVNCNINVMEDPLTSNYLKLAGLSSEKINKDTLIPLGILKFIHSMHIHNFTQKNGELTKYIKKDWNKDIIPLLKKHHNVRRLSTLTLVPLAIIMDKDILVNYLENNQDINMTNSQLQFIKDPMLMNYFKLIGLNKKNLYISTLVPLGILAVLHHLYYE